MLCETEQPQDGRKREESTRTTNFGLSNLLLLSLFLSAEKKNAKY